MSIEALSVRGLTKSFGGNTVLDNLSLDVAPGQVHVLLGHNGSGKSTLVKLISGFHTPSSGSIRIAGKELPYPITSARLNALGVGILHQDLALVSTMSVLENVLIGDLRTNRFGRIRWADEARRVTELLQPLHVRCRPQTSVSMLDHVDRVRVGLARAFAAASQPAVLLVLDEPTASLGIEESTQLLNTVRTLASRGCGILFICHNLNEAQAVADYITVLRDGRTVYSGASDALTQRDLAALVSGDQGGAVGSGASRSTDLTESTPVLTAHGLRGAALKDLSLSLRSREILGITGLAGSGYEEVLPLIFGTVPYSDGDVSVEGQPYSRRNPARSRSRGLALVSDDRLRSGGVRSATVGENIVLPALRQIRTRLGRVDVAREHRLAQRVVNDSGVKPPEPQRPLWQLSGGNQQKALVGRWLVSDARILLLCEPTAGIDVGAINVIYDQIEEFRKRGGGVLISSAQIDELLDRCDRIIVVSHGAVAGMVSRGDEQWRGSAILELCYSMPAEI